MGFSFSDIENANMRGITLKCDTVGRFLIPKALRQVLKLDENKEVTVYLLDDGYYLHVPNGK